MTTKAERIKAISEIIAADLRAEFVGTGKPVMVADLIKATAESALSMLPPGSAVSIEHDGHGGFIVTVSPIKESL